MQRVFWTLALGIPFVAVTGCDPWFGSASPQADSPGVNTPAGNTDNQPIASNANVEIGKPLYASRSVPDMSAPLPGRPGEVAVDPIVVRDCRLSVIESEEVPAQREGVIDFIATEVKPGETVPDDRQIVINVDGKNKVLRQLREDDLVEAGQLLAKLDDRIDMGEYMVKLGKIKVAQAEQQAADKTRDEAYQRYLTQQRLFRLNATSEEDLRGAELVWHKSTYDAHSKREAVNLAEVEARSAKTIVEMHEIRSKISGVIKTIHKHPGEAVKNLEPVFTIRKLSRLRAEGLVEAQHKDRIRQGMRAVIEPSRAESPQQTFIGHMLEVNGVAVSKDNYPVSGSEDGTVLVWDRATRQRRRMFRQPMGTPVRSLACTLPASPWNLCLAGGSDGNARLYDLDGKSDAPLRVLEGQHHAAPISAVAFSPDGKACATGSEDHSITIWETASGKPLFHFMAHRGPVTSLQFTPLGQLVSAGRDNILSVWTVGDKAARREEVPLTSRSGDVAVLGASADGRRVLFDQGKMLRVVSIPQGVTEGVLENPGTASNFTAFALFSPDGHLILTASTAEGRMQLWRSPAGPTRRVYEVRQLVSSDRTPSVTCAAFSPDGTFIVTGGRERQVLAWAVPSASEVDHEIAAEVTLVEPAVESANGQVRIWASFPNRDGRLLPGGTVAMAVYPPE